VLCSFPIPFVTDTSSECRERVLPGAFLPPHEASTPKLAIPDGPAHHRAQRLNTYPQPGTLDHVAAVQRGRFQYDVTTS